MAGLTYFFFWFKRNTISRLLLILICLAGSIYGFYYYQGQLQMTPPYLWPFVPDSPLFTLMYVFILIFYQAGIRSNTFDAFTFIGLNKVGLWTIFILLYNYSYYFQPSSRNYRLLLLALHLGMIAISLTLLKEMEKLRLKTVIAITSFFLISDLVDYQIGTHPLIPTDSVKAAATSALLLSLLVPSLLFHHLASKEKNL